MSCCGPKECNNFDDDREGVAEEDLARFGGDDIECPVCGAGLFHDVSQCSKCGHAMIDPVITNTVRSWGPILAVGAAVGILLMYVLWLIR